MKRKIRSQIAVIAGILLGCMMMSATALAAEAPAKALPAAETSAAAETEQVDGHTIQPFAGAMTADGQAMVRTGPSRDYPAVGSLLAGQVVNACGKADTGWYQVVYGTGIGYVSDTLLTEILVDENMRAALAAQAIFVKQNAAQLAAAQAAQEAQKQAALAAQEAQKQAALDAAALQQAQNAALTQQALPGGNLIFVGDSRVGQMSNAVGGPAAFPGTAFVSCFGGGNEWLSTDRAKADIDQYVTPGSVIILNYGVNDLSKHQDYIVTINKYARDWREKGAVVFFATVGPVGTNEYGKRNWAVEYFNNQLSGRLDGSIGRIDLYHYLVLTGYQTLADGLHYTPETYARMFQFLKQSVGK